MTPTQRDHEIFTKAADRYFGGYAALTLVVGFGLVFAGRMRPLGVCAIAAWLAFNLAMSALGRKHRNPVVVEAVRFTANLAAAPFLYLIPDGPYTHWWPGFLIIAVAVPLMVGRAGMTESPFWSRVLIAAHFGVFTLSTALGVAHPDWIQFFIHAGAVLMVSLMLAEAVPVLGRMIERERLNSQRLEEVLSKLTAANAALDDANATLREIPRRIQSSILPRELSLSHMSVSARMIPAEEVGGDYYDIIPATDGAWIGIGDVAGHGLEAGVIMLMVQSAVASLAKCDGDADPREVVSVVNDVLYENIRRRLAGDQHVTFCITREYDDGRFMFAGAHEDILVYRSRAGRCDRLETRGPWLGAMRSVREHTTVSSTRLDDGDIVVLYTDGITEARGANGEQFGLDRLCAAVERAAAQPMNALRDSIYDEVRRFTSRLDDDQTLIVARYSQAALGRP